MGRNKEFDEKVALQKAMELFWEQGYEKTSVGDLLEQMGIHRKSLYDTFGDKYTLYLSAIDCYKEYMAEKWNSELLHAKTPGQAIENIFNATIEGSENRPWGCFMVNAATEMALRDKEVEKKTEESFAQTEQFFAEIIREGQRTGEFSTAMDAEALAEIMHTTLLGIRVYVRTSPSKEKLRRMAEQFLLILKGK
jgi:TetR/AcrR family transcriptional repressor of nem operon